MTEADLHARMQKDALADVWRVALEHEPEARDESYTLGQAAGLLVKGGWKVKIIHVKDFDNPECEWLDFELPLKISSTPNKKLAKKPTKVKISNVVRLFVLLSPPISFCLLLLHHILPTGNENTESTENLSIPIANNVSESGSWIYSPGDGWTKITMQHFAYQASGTVSVTGGVRASLEAERALNSSIPAGSMDFYSAQGDIENGKFVGTIQNNGK